MAMSSRHRKRRRFTSARPHQLLSWMLRTVVLALALLTLQLSSTSLPVFAAGNVTIRVFDRATGQLVTAGFRYVINEDIAHTNASLTPPQSYSPVMATGDALSPTVTLPDGKYLVTVLGGPFPATPDDPEGYKLGGAHFTVDNNTQTIDIYLVPNPLPLATLRVRVFHDNFSVNNADDIPAEDGIPNMPIVLKDPIGEVTVDFFGNPICSQYDGNPNGSTPLGDPIPNTGGECKTGADGFAVIPNLPPLKYEIQVVPPDGSGWIQTTTIEGTHGIDAWLEEGASGYSTEVGFLTAAVWFGFVKECAFGDTGDSCPTNDDVPSDAGSITGRVRETSIDNDAPGAVALGRILPRPYVALNNISGNDEQVYTARGNADGTFTIPDVPPGTYQLVYWDFQQLYIIQFVTVSVGPNEAVDLGDIGIPKWRGALAGYAYLDTGVAQDGTVIPAADIPAAAQGLDAAKPGLKNGFRDCYGGADPHSDFAQCEPGIPSQDIGVRFKDGTLVYGTFADTNGYYEIPDYFPWEHFLVWEVGYGRHEQVGTAGYFTKNDGLDSDLPLGYPYAPENVADFGAAALLQAQLTWGGQINWIDTGKHPWGPGENGGISGIVYYATTRNEFNPRLAAAEDYEPGIPNVTINLYNADLDVNGQPILCTAVGVGCPNGNGELKRTTDAPIDSVQTDAWDGNHPTDCTYETPTVGSGVFVTDPQCLEFPRTWNQIKNGVFDGGYAFEGLPAGTYIVEVEAPANYRQIREEDQNTDQGDDFVPAIPPPPCAGPLHLVNDPRNPAHGTETPLCTSRIVELYDGFNAGAEFFLMTNNEVPPPGLLSGTLLDDLTLQLDPNSPLYIEKRGIPNTPIGILDFQNNEIARVYSDENGYWEVLLPSTYTAHCPTPGGICPAMVRVIGNYPGNPLNPDPQWNPNYGTLSLVFDIWPGKTTYADVALVPTTNLIPDPIGGFDAPPLCAIPAEMPEMRQVSTVYGPAGTAVTIEGLNFGNTAGTVTLGGTPVNVTNWSDTIINITIPNGLTAGAHQIAVIGSNGQRSPSGITFHLIGSGYTPTVREVGPGKSFSTIQNAIDVANDGDLVVVDSGIYFETLIIAKNIKLQGHGYGATLVDGRFFNFGGMTPQQFLDKVNSLAYDGPVDVPMGQVMTVIAQDNQFGPDYRTQIDGFAIRGGAAPRGNVPLAVTLQGGGIYAHAFARHLEISNNLVQTNSGLTGGGIILGQAYIENPDAGNALDNQNDAVHIHHNQVLNNGGFNLAGGIALFNGADDYELDHNTVCGNYSAEYGGGISHFGLSNGGWIHDNDIRFNYSFDEGGGLMVAGELQLSPTDLSAGAGDVRIERNLIQANVSNDDGGGIRLLQPMEGPIDIVNNMIANNLAADAGGGISMDDALAVSIINNTVAKNISTATAEDADRSTCDPPLLGSCPHAAGIVAEAFSQALRDDRGLSADSFPDPLLFNNIIWGNEAFYLDGNGNLPSAGIQDLEVVFTTTPQTMTPEYSVLTQPYGSGAGNVITNNPEFVEAIALSFEATAFAGDPSFIVILIHSAPTDPRGDYHILAASPAVDQGGATSNSVAAPCDDFDSEGRFSGTAHDIGADEVDGLPTACGAPPTNEAPQVNVGPDVTITMPTNSVAMNATVSDDGLPSNTLSYLWSQVSGPAGVSFAPTDAATTTVSFPGEGAYTLQLAVSDGALTSTDEVMVTVEPEAAGVPGDCNGDAVVNAGDISSVVLELFDGDGTLAADTAGGTFAGTAECDSNEDSTIDAGDISCTVLLIFNGANACQVPAAAAQRAAAEQIFLPIVTKE